MEGSSPQIDKTYCSRMSDHPKYFLNDHFIESLEIEGVTCYFQPFTETETFSTIEQQLNRISDEQISLNQSNLIIDKDMPLSKIITSQKYLKIFQKTLNKIAAKQPVQLEDFEDNKAIFVNIVNNIDKHNQKKGIESGGQIQIILHGRAQFASKVTYKTTSGSRLKAVLNYLDTQAGGVLPPIRVKDNQQVYDLSQQGQSIHLKTKVLFIEYPPVITFDHQDQQCTIHLAHSSFQEQNLKVLVKPITNLLSIIALLKEMLKIKSEPVEIKDSFGNIISLDRWGRSLDDLYLRKLQFRFFYTQKNTLSEIQVPDVPLKTTQLINTTVHQAQKQVVIEQQMLNVFQPQELYFPPKGYVRANTLLLVEKSQKKFQEIQVRQFLSQPDYQTTKIRSYNEKKHQVQFSYISCFKKETKKTQLLSIEVIMSQPFNSIFKIQCTLDTNFITDQLVWKPASQLKAGQRIMVLKENSREITSRCITQIKPIQLQQDEDLFSFEVQGHHTFICNHFIVHNENAISLTAYCFANNKPMVKKKVSCYLHNTINQIPEFKDKRIMMGGGLVLNNLLTFGDYSIRDFGTVSVFDGDEGQSSMLIISEWRDQSYVIGQQQSNKIEQLKNKWNSQCLALHHSKIIEVGNNLSNFEQPQKLSHILVGPKIILSKLFYLSNIQPLYSKHQQKLYQQFKKQWPMIGNMSKGQLSERDIYPIYLYTTNYIYGQLNNFLRSKDRSAWNSLQVEKWYTATNLIYRSLQKLPYNGEEIEVYRGIGKICLDKAFCLAQKDKPFCISQTKDNQRYLNIEYFTSCSTNIKVSRGFAGQKGALLTFKGKFKQSISQYSQFPHEQEVLLPPYLYFMITAYDTTGNIQTMTLQQIPFPRTTNNKLIYWVDDVPSNNTSLVHQFQNAGIEVVQVTTTRIMKVILRDFFSILHAFGKKIVIISDMARKEQGGIWNSLAGVELFNLIYNEYGMSNKAIIFTGDRQKALRNIQERGVNKGNWEVFTGTEEVRQAVFAEFND